MRGLGITAAVVGVLLSPRWYFEWALTQRSMMLWDMPSRVCKVAGPRQRMARIATMSCATPPHRIVRTCDFWRRSVRPSQTYGEIRRHSGRTQSHRNTLENHEWVPLVSLVYIGDIGRNYQLTIKNVPPDDPRALAANCIIYSGHAFNPLCRLQSDPPHGEPVTYQYRGRMVT